MSRNFVLAFGGTGARCAEAFTYLLASRAVTEPCHVLVIDPDQSNGNVSTVRDQLQRYLEVQSRVRGGRSTRPYFSTPVNGGEPTFFWANPSGSTTWQSTLGYDVLSEPARDLIGLLYDEDDLAMTFEKGYVGRAHIGSLDLFQTLQKEMKSAKDLHAESAESALQQFYVRLRAATQGKNRANLIVFGSIFGGTGASGLPAMPNILRETLGEELAERINLACVQIAPYFTFPDGSDRDPDSALHPLATQTAMRHYAVNDVGYDRIYLVGGPDRPSTSDQNNPGGSNQRNRAHYVELGAALGAAHFFASASGDAKQSSGATELMTGSAKDLAWPKLPFGVTADVQRNLVGLATFCILHGHYFGPDLADRNFANSLFEKKLMSKGSRRLGGREPELSELTEFATRYLDWISELQELTGSSLFTLDKEIAEDSARRVQAGGGKSGSAVRDIRERLDKRSAKLAGTEDDEQVTGLGFYVHALTQAVEEYCANNYASWS